MTLAHTNLKQLHANTYNDIHNDTNTKFYLMEKLEALLSQIVDLSLSEG